MTYVDTAMARLKSREEEELEQALGALWRLAGEGWFQIEEGRRLVAQSVSETAYEALFKKGWLREDAKTGKLEPEGAALAREVTRRHLLAERLLTDVLSIGGPELDASACQWEHVLSSEVTRSICALLGHPRRCPHGEAIPEGDCCLGAEAVEPLFSTLARLEPGRSGRVAYISLSEAPLLHRLLSLGLAPGSRVRVRAQSPACICQVGETVVALETELAEAVVVRTV